jgi:photosystem II stability/assembly factor-like uncharacterized protein
MFISYQVRSQTWITQNVNPINDGFNFWCMSVVDNMTVMGIGETVDQANFYPFVSRTVDGGNSWTSLPLDSDWEISSFQALSADTAWISIALVSGFSSGFFKTGLYKTTDGGQTWVKNLTIPFDSVSSYIDDMHFFNSNEGVAFGDVHNGSWEVYYTTDGGIQWNPAVSIPAPLSGEICSENLYYTWGDNMWITSGRGRVFHTADKGVNWTASQITPIVFPDVFRVAFYDALEGIAVFFHFNSGSVGNIYRTHDGGATWSQVTYSGVIQQNYSEGGLFIVPGSNVVFVNSGHPAVHGSSFSADSGLTWNLIDANRYGAINGKDWNSLWTGQYSSTMGTGGVAKWDGVSLGIKQNEQEINCSVSPNPCNGKFTIQVQNSANNKIKISVENVTGQKVFENHYIKHNEYFSQSIDLKNNSAGIYIVKVFDGEKSYCKKLIVK